VAESDAWGWLWCRIAECTSYTDVYRTYGLLHERAYFAHCCHCGGDERELLKAHEAGYGKITQDFCTGIDSLGRACFQSPVLQAP
jgi:hypothetical protein